MNVCSSMSLLRMLGSPMVWLSMCVVQSVASCFYDIGGWDVMVVVMVGNLTDFAGV